MGAPYALSSDLVSAWPAKSLEVAQYIDGQLPLIAMTQNAQTGTTYTLAATDFTKLVTLSNASPVTVTVPLESSVAWVAGTQLRLMNLGAGLVTVAGAVGVTINGSPLTLARYKDATLTKTGTNTWTFTTSGGSNTAQANVVQTVDTTARATTSTSMVTTSISATITPTLATSRVLIAVQGAIGWSTGLFAAFTVYRGATDLNTFSKTGLYVAGENDNASASMGAVAFNYIDSPGVATATTYTLYFRGSNASFNIYLGRDNSNSYTCPTFLTVSEIPA